VDTRLDSIQAQAAAEAAPTIVDPIQQTVAAVLRDHLNNPTLKRNQVRAALRALGQPMRHVEVKRLKTAYGAYLVDQSVGQLLTTLRSDAETEEVVEPQPSPPQRTLTAEDLHLVCWEYVWS
jgi:ribosomal protein S24E